MTLALLSGLPAGALAQGAPGSPAFPSASTPLPAPAGAASGAASGAPAPSDAATQRAPIWGPQHRLEAEPVWAVSSIPSGLMPVPQDKLLSLRYGMNLDAVRLLLGEAHSIVRSPGEAGEVWQYVARDYAGNKAFIASLWFGSRGLWLATGRSRPVGKLAEMPFSAPPLAQGGAGGTAGGEAAAVEAKPVATAAVASGPAVASVATAPAASAPVGTAPVVTAPAITAPAAPAPTSAASGPAPKPVEAASAPAPASAGAAAPLAPADSRAAASPAPVPAQGSALAPLVVQPAPQFAVPRAVTAQAGAVPAAAAPGGGAGALAASTPGASVASTPVSASASASATASSSTPAPASSPTPAAAPDQTLALRDAVDTWLAAWSRQDVAGYLAAYAPAYVPPGRKRAEWERERRERIRQPVFIRVHAEEMKVEAAGTRPRVSFLQRYESERYEEKSRKVLTFVKQEGRWLIEKEENVRLR
jgi:hypothetical protein